MTLCGRTKYYRYYYTYLFHVHIQNTPLRGMGFFWPQSISGITESKNGHGDTSSDTAVSLKKGDFITPSVNPFFKRKTAAWFHFKPPLGHLYFDEPARTQSPIQRFFYMPLGDLPAKSLSNRLNWTLSHFVSNVLKYSKIFLLSCTIPFFSQVWWNNCISSSFLLLTIWYCIPELCIYPYPTSSTQFGTICYLATRSPPLILYSQNKTSKCHVSKMQR